MGCNKALLNFGGKPLISILIDKIRSVTEHIVISSNDDSLYQFLNVPVIPDQFKGHGPLAGFHSVMRHENCPVYLMLACDLPNLKESLLSNLLALVDGYDAAIPLSSDGLAHPLCAAYRQTCMLPIERSLKRGTRKVIDTFLEDTLRVKWISPEEGRFQDTDLANINTPEDLEKLKSAAR